MYYLNYINTTKPMILATKYGVNTAIEVCKLHGWAYNRGIIF